jgi:hypothetical protein
MTSPQKKQHDKSDVYVEGDVKFTAKQYLDGELTVEQKLWDFPKLANELDKELSCAMCGNSEIAELGFHPHQWCYGLPYHFHCEGKDCHKSFKRFKKISDLTNGVPYAAAEYYLKPPADKISSTDYCHFCGDDGKVEGLVRVNMRKFYEHAHSVEYDTQTFCRNSTCFKHYKSFILSDRLCLPAVIFREHRDMFSTSVKRGEGEYEDPLVVYRYEDY